MSDSDKSPYSEKASLHNCIIKTYRSPSEKTSRDLSGCEENAFDCINTEAQRNASSQMIRQTTEKNSVALKGQTTQKNIVAFEESNATHEDQEDFQDQEHYHHNYHCNEELMMVYGEYCRVNFNASMTELGAENWCNMEMIVRSYHELTDCLETMSMFALCFYPNRVVEGLFLATHQQYFHSCNDEDELPDAPAEVVLAAPCCPSSSFPS
ncbi:hypothetical protein E1301_Tti024105 [Triplophysa tibetana]|uniref:Uncharacterized protein n=1 Tax=Triplophysa tibetana TaxID=1572043 RepID=A0A5A9N7M4_9TELE|nr:hypothetical protein E1301_Tti024105 [Triplophysa tibetana]